MMQANFLDQADPNARRGEYEIADGANVLRCRSCDAEIVFAFTAAGRAIPLSLATVQTRHGKRYALTHFSDCPHSEEWSNKKARPE